MGLKAQKNPRSNYQIGSRIVKNFPNFFRVLGTLTEIMTKKMVNCSKKIPGHFQDKTLKMVNSRTNSRTKKIPGHFQDFQDAWTP